MFRYWGDDAQTKSVMKHHDDDPSTIWMHTGDVGIMNEEGYLRGIILIFYPIEESHGINFAVVSRIKVRNSVDIEKYI